MPWYISFTGDSATSAGVSGTDNTTASTSSWTITAGVSTTNASTYVLCPSLPDPIPLSVEEQARQRAEIESRRIGEEARQQERALAVRSAEELLRECLGEDCFQEYKVTGQVRVDSPSRPGRRYVVCARQRIRVYEGDRLVDELCLHLVELAGRIDNGWLPEADVVLGKVLLLEHDEERVLRTANHGPV